MNKKLLQKHRKQEMLITNDYRNIGNKKCESEIITNNRDNKKCESEVIIKTYKTLILISVK